MKHVEIHSYEILKHLGSDVVHAYGPEHRFSSISTDSRSSEPNSLFVSLEKDPEKAREYALKAIARGAIGVLSQHDWGLEGVPSFVVRDASDAFYTLSGLWRQKFNIPVISVAGNVGKTTSKEMVAFLLETSGKKVLKTEGSQNGFQGIPSTLIKLRGQHEFAVIEVGIDEPDTMALHADLVQPTHVLISSLGCEHLEKLNDPLTAAREEFELVLWGARNGSVIVLNGDNEYCRDLAFEYPEPEKFAFYALDPSSEHHRGLLRWQGSFANRLLSVSVLGLHGALEASYQLSLNLPGLHNALNLLGAVSVVLSLGIEPRMSEDLAREFSLPGGRSELRQGPKGATVLCDYYNASPESMAAAFTSIADLQKSKNYKRIWLCLGDMLGLGAQEEAYHRGLASILPEGAVLFTFGSRMSWVQNQLEKINPKAHRRHFESLAELARALYESFTDSDLVLIKGSRGMSMEGVWSELAKLDSSQTSP